MRTKADKGKADQGKASQNRLTQTDKIMLRIEQLRKELPPYSVVRLTIVTGEKREIHGWHVEDANKLEGG